ncbi:MAG: hypothetical protein KJZ68_04790 [Phycisphaerales bacterium]|nr:hypothetical protein [Phycisphaerales bacterium]
MRRTPSSPQAASAESSRSSFEAEAEAVVASLRGAFAEVIETALGRVATAKEVADGFGVHRKLGWQIARGAYDDDPFHAARFVPTRRAIEPWLDAARSRRVPDEVLARVDRAMESFERLLHAHAGDRESLEMMLESCAASPDAEADLRWRGEAFRGQAYILGVRVKTLLSMAVLAPSADRSGWFDMARVNAHLGFVRTRSNVRWVIGQSVVMAGPDGSVMPSTRQPLAPDDAARHGGVPLIERFCSAPLPPIVRRPGPEGLVEDELQAGPIGARGEVNLVTGEIMRSVGPVWRSREGEDALFGTGVRTPAEMLLCDLFVHRDLFPGVERTIRVYSELFSPVAHDERDRLAVSDQVHSLGRGLMRLSAPEAPRYAMLAAYVFERCGWEPTAFDLYRIRMAYPPLPASVMFHHPLPPAPAGVNESTPGGA